jgi:hypothetical protein
MRRKNVRPVANAAEPDPSILGIFLKFKSETLTALVGVASDDLEGVELGV